jgi:four helix bundle protein
MKNMQCKTQSGSGATSLSAQKGDDILRRLLEFAARVGKVVDALPETRLGRHVAGQLVRCGTSPAPNYAEGRAAESRDDFCHKLSIALKELRESHVWLLMIAEGGMLARGQLSEVIDECDQLSRIIAQSIITAKRNRPTR